MSANEPAGPNASSTGSASPPGPPPPPETSEQGAWPYIGVGCLTTVIGFFGGGMIAMLFGKVTDAVTGCQPPAGLPVCTWWRYWWTGALVGAVLLPVIAVRRLRRGRRMSDDSRGTRQGGAGGAR